MFDQFHDVKEKPTGQCQRQGSPAKLGRRRVVHQPPGSAEVDQDTVPVFVTGETNTDDLRRRRTPEPPDIRCTRWRCSRTPAPASPGRRRQARPGEVHPDLRARVTRGLRRRRGRHRSFAQIGDQQRVLFTGEDIPFIPNKRFGGVCLAAKIAPIFYNTMEDAGALPVEIDVSQMNMGDTVSLPSITPPAKSPPARTADHRRERAEEPVLLDGSSRRWPHSVDRWSRSHQQGA